MKDLLELKEKIEDADMILLGIGEELSLKQSDILQSNPIYQSFRTEIEGLEEEVRMFIEDCLYLEMLKQGEHPQVKEVLDCYRRLKLLTAGKNIFVITTCNDDLIDLSGLEQGRVVKPCGTRNLMQCCENCQDEVMDVADGYDRLYRCLSDMYHRKDFSVEEVCRYVPRCPKCQMYMIHNMIGGSGYSEQGYLPQWKRYTLWLQGTLNKKLCLLELGENFRYPTVIRWPFEKMTNLNQKSVLIRVNETLPQVTKEIAERAHSVPMNSREFLKKITAIPGDKQIQIEEDEDVKAE